MQKKNLKLREYSFHIVGKSHDKEAFPVELQHFWEVIILQLNNLTLSFRIRVRALTLMGNHFHLLISSHYENADLVCATLREGIHRLSNQEFLSELSSFRIIHPVYYQYAYKYLYRNPVSAGLCQRVQDYPFVSLHNVLGKKPEMFLLFDNMNLIHDPERILRWLNEPLQYPPNSEDLNKLFGQLSL